MAIRFTKKRQEDAKFVVSVCRAYLAEEGISMEDVAKKMDISEGAVSKCIYIAGINNWITYQMLCDIKAKEHFQQCKHYDERAKKTSSDRYFDNVVFPDRRKRIRNTLTKDYAIEVAKTYIKYASDRNVHKRMGLSILEMNDILIKGSICRYISEEDVHTICEISRLKSGSVNMMEKVLKARDEYVFLPGEISERERMLANYDEVYSDADEAPSKEDLETSIAKKKARLDEIVDFIEHWHK